MRRLPRLQFYDQPTSGEVGSIPASPKTSTPEQQMWSSSTLNADDCRHSSTNVIYPTVKEVFSSVVRLLLRETAIYFA